ncbi:embryonic testis differentiation protein-like [Mastomys coucha]|uniref:embryonic testis differentiation protein-like n=1 Tax=Mastomys coucha TaxID=35658 RepID=UPI0012616D59|nr:embryonic testis differentiation protein-like [Mastomys coucha]XP_031229658.1 embryonic testis differentiation protein-like [Mastomys coucha]XP_031229659.1 embryonic testis differentiation protein-like [Mastomys coucha]
MDKVNPEAVPNPQQENMEVVPPKELKCQKSAKNILIYLIGRQMGKPRNNMDLFEWAWSVK